MAYDPKDPADKKIVDKLIADALAEAAETHEAEVERLTGKNTELLGKLKKAREGKADADTVETLEAKLGEAEKGLKDAQKALKKAEAQRDEFKTNAELADSSLKTHIVDGKLTEALTAAKVKPELLKAAKKMLADGIELVVKGDERLPMVSGKPLADHVKAWAAGDEGKAFVSASVNGGGNASGGNAAQGAGGKPVIARSAYEANPQSFAVQLAKQEITLGD